ncbi:ABC-type nitrate/sulfonate/bicarbonate transport system, permease component [Cystobacter fuscus]|uniref:ABC-type nitrate/sulfonate/bicarbonate transport system, permease component n=1 Tax=Cystobacter fuscus TaxID=43 RepID=A0A250J5V4_9BACT|nr:ABC transporter permease [Cystobacter fuscus]ATB38920.1 ABC-type nitrate/sulfonate/bicarbonate transport system, permease component [Cystobacter fuscus]
MGLILFVLLWDLALYVSGAPLLPRPWQVGLGLLELLRRGVLFKHLIASLFRVTWGFLLAVAVALPLGFVLGWSLRAGRALGPFVQLVRPISPLAWIPLAILWFGLGDVSAIFIIFIASAPPLTLAAMNAVRNVPEVYVRAGQNFGLDTRRLFLRVLLPAALPELLSGMRLTLGISWLVVVAAEMIAVNSGLGYLIIDSRNAGNRYDLVVAGMVLIGLTGLVLDRVMARVARSLMHHQDVVGEEPG